MSTCICTTHTQRHTPQMCCPTIDKLDVPLLIWLVKHMLCFATLDERCPPVPLVPHSHTETHITDVEFEVTIECLPGYEFPNNADNVTIRCTSARSWDKQPPQCLSK